MDIKFYHLSRATPAQILPELLVRARAKSHKIMVRCETQSEADSINDALWVHPADSFLPHDLSNSKDAANQSILVGVGLDNPHGADVLFLMPRATADLQGNWSLCCTLLDGSNPEEIATGRANWKQWKDAGHTLTYWQQSEQGKWEQKG
nr:DNA polymerase III subunit chi [Alphaproteobacteria bacterium]